MAPIPPPPAIRELGELRIYLTQASGYGYVLGGTVRARHLEVKSGQLALCVELLDEHERARLRAFCQQHQELLRGKVVVFRPVEQWAIASDEAG
ncbi:MAG: hypothetical protein ACRYFK_01120 [Janthinobacterium lividum]